MLQTLLSILSTDIPNDTIISPFYRHPLFFLSLPTLSPLPSLPPFFQSNHNVYFHNIYFHRYVGNSGSLPKALSDALTSNLGQQGEQRILIDADATSTTSAYAGTTNKSIDLYPVYTLYTPMCTRYTMYIQPYIHLTHL